MPDQGGSERRFEALYTALESAGWTDASPALPPPSTRQASMMLPADPTEEFTPCWQTGCRIAGF